MKLQIKVNNIDLHYVKEGKGNPLILLHGNGEDHTIFCPLMKMLASRFTVYAVDSRNHGSSSKTSDYSYESIAEDVYQFIQTLESTKVFVVGFSDGAIAAAMVEMAYPNTFGKMALLGMNLKPSDFKKENIQYLNDEYERTKDPLVKMMLEEPNIELVELRDIHASALIIRAEDELFEDSLYVDIVNAMPDARLLIMKGHDHASYVVDSTVLYDDLIGFFT